MVKAEEACLPGMMGINAAEAAEVLNMSVTAFVSWCLFFVPLIKVTNAEHSFSMNSNQMYRMKTKQTAYQETYTNFFIWGHFRRLSVSCWAPAPVILLYWTLRKNPTLLKQITKCSGVIKHLFKIKNTIWAYLQMRGKGKRKIMKEILDSKNL